MPKRVGRIALGDPRQLQVAGHAIADLPGTEWQAPLPGHTAGEDIAYRGGLEWLPLPEGGGDIGRQIDDPIHLPFTVVHARRALPQVDGRPGEATDLAHAEATPQH
jgi:hypothetical protein